MKQHKISDLIKKVATKNDARAYKTLYQHYFNRLFVFSLRYVKSRELAEEVLSDVFVKVWKNRERLSDVSNLETFLYISVRNQSLNYIKKYLNNNHQFLSIDDVNLEFAIDSFTPESSYLVEELKNDLDDIVNSLPPSCKNAFYLVKEDGLSYKEAAKVLGISPFTVKNQVLKAIKKLKEGLTKKALEEESKVLAAKVIDLKSYKFLIIFFLFFQIFPF